MSFKHSSAVKTLNGKSGWWFRKCLFSVTKTSAPIHSVYAAIKASASFKPFLSYLAPNSKGIRKSSSIVVNSEMNSKNSRNSLWTKLRLTSSTIVRGIRNWCSKGEDANNFTRDWHDCFTGGVKAKMYMFVSSTRSKFCVPKFFPCFPQLFDYFFFGHAFKRRLSLSHKLAKFFEMLQGTFRIRFFCFHYLSPHFKFTMKLKCCQIDYLDYYSEYYSEQLRSRFAFALLRFCSTTLSKGVRHV